VTESGSPPSRGRGRPRAGADPQGPLADWINGLSPTAIHVVNVGRRVLVEDGFEAVTIEHVALEANVSPATIRRQFVSKSGLLYAIFSRLEAEAWEKLVADVQPISPAEARLHAYISGLGALIEDPSNGVGLTEVLAHGLRDPILRQKMAADYPKPSTLEPSLPRSFDVLIDGALHPDPEKRIRTATDFWTLLDAVRANDTGILPS